MSAVAKINLGGLVLEQEIGSGASSVMYRATRDGVRYAVKVLNAKMEAAESWRRFLGEASILARLNHPGLVRVQDVARDGHTTYLVLDYIDGLPLKDLLEEGELGEEDLYELAVTMAGALSEVHRYGLIHRDIKPANIMADRDGGFKLIDFGLAAQVERLRSTGFVGSFQYSSPEQLGVLTRPIDARSDLYSLGVVLFEAASGRRPFESKEIGELWSKLASEKSPLLSEVAPKVRPEFARVVDRLLARDPDDRFAAASDLLLALKTLPSRSLSASANQRIQAILNEQQELETPFVERSQVMGPMRAAWAEIKRQQPKFISVEGEAGSGKSRVLRQFCREIASEQMFLLASKCVEDVATPYASLRSALQSFLAQTSRMPDRYRTWVKELIQKTIKEELGMILRFCPELEAYADPALVQKIRDSDYLDTSLLQAAVVDFFIGLSANDVPVVLRIDDIQWADGSTLEVLRRIREKSEYCQLLVLLSVRAKEMQQLPVVQRLVNHPKMVLRINLDAMSAFEGVEFVRSLLGGADVDANRVSQIVNRCRGNPFVLGQYVRAMLDEGMLRYSWGRWLFEMASADLLKLPEDALQLIVERLKDVRPDTISVLRFAAVLGSSWPKALLEASGRDRHGVEQALQEAIRAGLVERAGDTLFQFVHDKVREVLFEQNSEAELADLHDLAARALEKLGDVRYLYEKATHFAKGHWERNPLAAFEACQQAGTQALREYALEEAYDYFRFASEVAEKKELPRDTKFDIAFARACALTQRFSEAISVLETAIQKTDDVHLRCRMRLEMGQTYFMSHLDERTCEVCYENLRDLGVSASQHPVWGTMVALTDWILGLAIGLTPRFLWKNISARRKQRYMLLAETYYVAGFGHYLQTNMIQWIQLALRAILPANVLGEGKEYVHAYCVHAGLLAAVRMRRFALTYVEKAIEAAKKLDDQRTLGRAYFWRSGIDSLSGNLTASAQQMNDLVMNHRRILDHGDLSNACGEGGWNFGSRGYHEDGMKLIEIMEATLDEMTETNREVASKNPLYCFALQHYGPMGRMREAEALIARYEKAIADRPKDPFLCTLYSMLLLGHCAETRDVGLLADKAIERARRVIKIPELAVFHFRWFFVTHAYVEALRFDLAPIPEKRERIREFKKALGKLRRVSGIQPFKVHYVIHKAVLQRMKGNFRKAIQILNEAEALAERHDSPYARYEANREKARNYLQSNKPLQARNCLQIAFSLSMLHGWKGRITALRKEFGHVIEEFSSRSSEAWSSSTQHSAGSSLRSERHLSSLVQLSLTATTVLDPDAQGHKAVSEVIRILGAERGFLFLWDEKTEQLSPYVSLNKDGQPIDSEKLSRTVLEQVVKAKQPVIVTGDESGDIVDSKSISVHQLRSVIAGPLLMGEQVLGVLYLDNHLAKGIFNRRDIEVLQAVGAQVVLSLEMSRAAKIELERREFAHDLEVIGAVQNLLLPKQHTIKGKMWDLASYYQPASTAGGDWWWFDENADGDLVAILGDVTGHGAGAAMVTALLTGTFTGLFQDKPYFQPGDQAITDRLEKLHRLFRDFCAGSYWMTLSVVKLEAKTRKVTYFNLGGPPLIILGPNSLEVEMLAPRGMPLGADEIMINHESAILERGSRLGIMTDGAYEMRLPTGRELGLRGMSKLIIESRTLRTEQACDAIARRLGELRGTVTLQDDLALLLLTTK